MTKEVKSTESKKLKTYHVHLTRVVAVEDALVEVEAPDQKTAESLALKLAEEDDAVFWDWHGDADLEGDPEVCDVEEVKDLN